MRRRLEEHRDIPRRRADVLDLEEHGVTVTSALTSGFTTSIARE